MNYKVDFKSDNELICEIAHFSNIIILCVTNTPIALKIIKEIFHFLKKNTLIIDITTHNSLGSKKIEKILSKKKIRYVECPVMGGPLQAEQGVLGGIVGCNKKIFPEAKKILLSFCKEVFYFGEIGMGAKTKLVSNFLSLGTTTFVIETIKAANHFNIDLQKLYDVAKLGSGNSAALTRIADKAVNGDYKGYIFSVDNTFKDFSYIHNMLKDLPEAEKLSSLVKSFYQEAKNKGYGNLLISELIEK